MKMYYFLVIWEGRKCVEILEFGGDFDACTKAYEEIMAPVERGEPYERTAQTYLASSRSEIGVKVGYELDENYCDEWDWSSEMGRDD